MAKWGKVNFSQLKNFQKKIDRLDRLEKEAFHIETIKELAARLLSKVIKKTPVAEVNGGTLRRGWTAKSDLKVTKIGNTYEVEIINPVEYASYVEYGHRTPNHDKWVDGKFMLTISEKELDDQAPKIVEKKLEKWLGEALNGK